MYIASLSYGKDSIAMLKWDKDSDTVFKTGGRTVKYFEDRFAEEEKQLRFEGDKWI